MKIITRVMMVMLSFKANTKGTLLPYFPRKALLNLMMKVACGNTNCEKLRK